jgi:RimJ/RimL family protein N-acetyltransferase
MRIEAEGCVLRPLRGGDVPAITRACQDPEIARWLPHLPHPYRATDAREFVAHATAQEREITLAIADDADTLVGVVNVRLTDAPPTVGYWIAPGARGRGIATAATSAIARWTFAVHAPARIALHVEPENRASVRVAEKCGFVRLPGMIKGLEDRDLWVFQLARPTHGSPTDTAT